ncbi:MAG: ribosomal protection-like ABC-F family protein [Clostridium sp.]|uniref:ribosomal protection-like ABC-F family protein n=1 Tax=Clostridium sp. TaxID=1506 RepID=UPI003D6C8DF4
MIELTLYNIIKHFGDTLILNDINFKVYDGEKVGVVGINGSGKSTILKLIAGIEPTDRDNRYPAEARGWIAMTKGTSVAYLEQLPSYPDGFKVNDILNLAFADLYSLEQQLRVLESNMGNLQGVSLERALKQYSQMQENYDAKGGYEREEKLSKVCSGLKLDAVFLEKDFNILSGGEKTTVILGKILLQNPDILLLDEPTNHLDMESVEWLENYLRSYKGIVMIVSHDRYFLDNVVKKIIEVEDKVCETYKGNYSAYVKQKEENMLLQYENYREQKKKVKSMEKTIKDLRDWALRADNNKFFRRAVSIQKKLDKMDRIDKPIFEKQNIKLNFKTTDRAGYEIIKVCDLSKSFDNKVIFKDAKLYVTLGERIALIGSNGSGKTTFLKMLLNETTVDNGEVALGANVKVGYLPQNIIFNNEEDTVIECFRENKSILEGKAREHLAKFMFFGKEAFKKVKHLSGGERVRLKLSTLLYDEINLLILDEPTNHLDIDSMETLEEALEDFKGTIFFVSHDRYFINKVCNRVVAIEKNNFVNYLGNYDHYKNKKNELCKSITQPRIIKKDNNIKQTIINNNKKNQIDLSKLEINIESLEEEVKEVDKSMVALGTNHDELNKLYCKREELSNELDKMIELWEISNNEYMAYLK